MGRARREGHWWYYLDDGLYGSYSGQLYDHARYPVEPLRDGAERLPSVLAGPTCDSIDVIAENLMLPQLQGRRPDRRARHGRLHLGQRLGVQLLSQGDGGGGQHAARRHGQRAGEPAVSPVVAKAAITASAAVTPAASGTRRAPALSH